MSVVDFLRSEGEINERRVFDLTSRIEDLERDLTRLRDEREDCYRRQLELRIAANIVDEHGLTVERVAGTWTASIEKNCASSSKVEST